METAKDLIYAGLGVMSEIKEKFEKSFNDLAERGKKEDEKHIIGDFFKGIEEMEQNFKTKIEDLKSKVNSAIKKEEEVKSEKK